MVGKYCNTAVVSFWGGSKRSLVTLVFIIGGLIGGIALGYVASKPLGYRNPIEGFLKTPSGAPDTRAASEQAFHANCERLGTVAAEVASAISSSALGLQVDTTMTVTIVPSTPPAGLGKAVSDASASIGPATLTGCLGYNLPLPRSVGSKGKQVVAKFDLPVGLLNARPYLSAPLPPVFVDTGLWTQTFVGVSVCPPTVEEVGGSTASTAWSQFGVAGSQHSSFVPLLCRPGVTSKVTISVSGLRSQLCACAQYGSPPFAEKFPTLNSRAVKREYVVSVPEPQEASFDEKNATVTWQFANSTTPAGVQIGLPLATRIAMTVKDIGDSPGSLRISLSYLAYASSALVAMLAAALAIFRIKRPAPLGSPYSYSFTAYPFMHLWRWVSLFPQLFFMFVKVSLIIMGVVLIGALGINAPVSWSPMLGVALLLLGLLVMDEYNDQKKKSRIALIAALVGISCVVPVLYFKFRYELQYPTAFVQLQDFPPKILRWLTWSGSYLTIMLALALVMLVYLLAKVIYAVTPDAAARVRVRRWLARFTVSALSFTVGYMFISDPVWSTFSTYHDYYTGTNAKDPNSLPTEVLAIFASSNALGSMLSLMLVPFITLFAIAVLVISWMQRMDASAERRSWGRFPYFPSAMVIALVLTLAVTWSDRGTVAFGLTVPVWLVQFILLWLLLAKVVGRKYALPAQSYSGERIILLSRLRQNHANRAADGGYDHTDASRLLEIGPADSVLTRASIAARIAAFLAIPAVIFIIWTFSVGDSSESWGRGWTVSFALVAALFEISRWVVTGLVFGYLYQHLPCRTGPAKALCFAMGWATSAWITVAIASLSGAEVVQPTIYRTAQFIVLAVVVGLVYDYLSVKVAGGTWRDLRRVYTNHNYVEIVTVAAPVLLAVIALVNQILAGAGFEAAETVINGVKGVVTASQ